MGSASDYGDPPSFADAMRLLAGAAAASVAVRELLSLARDRGLVPAEIAPTVEEILSEKSETEAAIENRRKQSQR